MACLARCRLTVFVAQGTYWHTMPVIVLLCVKSKDDDNMKHSTFFNCMWCPSYMIACHTRRSLTMCFAQRQWWHAVPDVVRRYVMSNGNYCTPRRTLSDRSCWPRELMACYAQRHPTMCVAQGQWWHVTPDIVCVCVTRVIFACHALRGPIVCVVQGRW